MNTTTKKALLWTSRAVNILIFGLLIATYAYKVEVPGWLFATFFGLLTLSPFASSLLTDEKDPKHPGSVRELLWTIPAMMILLVASIPLVRNAPAEAVIEPLVLMVVAALHLKPTALDITPKQRALLIAGAALAFPLVAFGLLKLGFGSFTLFVAAWIVGLVAVFVGVAIEPDTKPHDSRIES